MGLFDWLERRKRQAALTADVAEQLRELRADMRQLRLDWEVTYDKVRRALATLSRRQAREVERGGDDLAAPSIQDAPGSTNGPDGRMHPAEVFRLNQLARRR